MSYECFPFGKYKGVKLEEIPLTYFVYALEEFSLPDELKADMQSILLRRLGIEYGLHERDVVAVYKDLYETCTKTQVASLDAIYYFKQKLMELI